MMGKKQKQQKRLIRELEAALAQTLSDLAIERQENRSLREVIVNDRQRHEAIVDAMTNGMQRLTEERDELRLELAGMTSDVALDAALADVETLTEANAEADATIGELRKGLETLQAQHSAVSDALDLEREHSAMTISKLRDDLADTRERLDAALTEAARMRKEWTGDVTAAREVIERKSNEIVDLRRTISELRGDLAEVRGDLERATEFEHEASWRELAMGRLITILQRGAEIQRLKNQWQHAEDLLKERERELDALQAEVAEWQAVD